MKTTTSHLLGMFMGAVLPLVFCASVQAQIHSWGYISNGAQRFQVFSGNFTASVLDRETGLIWTKSPISTGVAGQAFAMESCNQQAINGRMGWRMPKVEELLSLKDISVFGPDNTNLPLGHPFLNVLSGNTQFYWSSTTVPDDPTSAYGVSMSSNQNTPTAFSKDSTKGLWCVRGGTN